MAAPASASISQAPGAEFLERRMRHATAVTAVRPAEPAERSPEVAAFVESVQLGREVCELLPLTDAGEPALPDTPATWRKVDWHLLQASAVGSCRLPPCVVLPLA